MIKKTIFLSFLLLVPVIGLGQSLDDQLIAAARKNDVAAVKDLLAKGAKVDAKTEYGATPLFFACDRGNAEIVKILLEHGADMNLKDTFYNSTPISWAVMRDRAEVVKVMLEKQPAGREMVMSMAVNQGQKNIAKILLESGEFKPEALTSYLAMAERGKHAEIVEMLKKAGAKPKTRVEYKLEIEALKQYVGVFKNDRMEVTVKVENDKLIGVSQGQPFTMIPVEKHTFELDGAPGVTVIYNLEGEKIAGFTIKQPGGETTLKKQEGK